MSRDVLPSIAEAYAFLHSSPSSTSPPRPPRLVLVGHSMGAAVAAIATHLLRRPSLSPHVQALLHRYRVPLKHVPLKEAHCWAFATPACMTADLAGECEDFVTSLVAHHDLVPR